MQQSIQIDCLEDAETWIISSKRVNSSVPGFYRFLAKIECNVTSQNFIYCKVIEDDVMFVDSEGNGNIYIHTEKDMDLRNGRVRLHVDISKRRAFAFEKESNFFKKIEEHKKERLILYHSQ